MSEDILDSILINGLQSYDTYETLNSVQISIKSNNIISDLNCYKNYKCSFLANSLLFSASITNSTNVIFISCTGLNDAKEALINGKIYKIIGIINLDQIKNWKTFKSESIYVNTNLIDTLYPYNSDYFTFGFETKSPIDLLNFSFSLLDGKGQLINFASNEKKLPVTDFTIQVLK